MKLIGLDAFRTQPGVGGHVDDCLEMAVRLWGRTLPYYEVEA